LAELGYTMKVGFELEFQIYRGDIIEPIETNGYNNARSMDRFS
jgi:hypothetical protein